AVFDYEHPTTGGSHVLFSVQFVPPTQADALARARREGTRRVAWLLVLTLVAALWLVPAGVVRVGLALVPLGLALRAPLGALLGVPRPFDPSVFSSPLLGVVSAAAGPLAVIGVVLILVGALLWERAPARRLPSLLAAGVLLVGAPYLLGGLGRGIVPPSAGVTIGVWLVWHLTLFALAAGMVTVAAALVRGTAEPSGWRSPLLGAALAVVAAAVGVWVWNARYGWPDWYTLLWLPPLVLVTRPADRLAGRLRGRTPPGTAMRIPQRRAPRAHHLLLVRPDSPAVLSVALGPRSALVPRARLGRLLDPTPPRAPLYRLTLAPAPSIRAPSADVSLWHRESWSALGERAVTIAGFPRDVFGAVELGTP